LGRVRVGDVEVRAERGLVVEHQRHDAEHAAADVRERVLDPVREGGEQYTPSTAPDDEDRVSVVNRSRSNRPASAENSNRGGGDPRSRSHHRIANAGEREERAEHVENRGWRTGG